MPPPPEWPSAPRGQFLPERLAALPERIQILADPLHGGRRLRLLNVEKLHDPCPVLAACLPRPQVNVKEHLAPALYLSFQLGLKGVPLAQ
jgi:hypothetical protein